MSVIDLPIQAGQLPVGFCPNGYQALLNGFSAVQSAVLNLAVGIGVQVSATTPTNTLLPWLQLDQNGAPIRWYWFYGSWLSPHPLITGMCMPWFGALPGTSYVGSDGVTYLAGFDGGDSATGLLPGPSTGPMWSIVGEAAARFPLAAGTMPSGSNYTTPGQTGGEEAHVLTPAEQGKVQFSIGQRPVTGAGAGGAANCVNSLTIGAGSGQASVNTADSPNPPNLGPVNALLAGTDNNSHNTLPPLIVMNWIRRTSRQFYSVPL